MLIYVTNSYLRVISAIGQHPAAHLKTTCTYELANSTEYSNTPPRASCYWIHEVPEGVAPLRRLSRTDCVFRLLNSVASATSAVIERVVAPGRWGGEVGGVNGTTGSLKKL